MSFTIFVFGTSLFFTGLFTGIVLGRIIEKEKESIKLFLSEVKRTFKDKWSFP